MEWHDGSEHRETDKSLSKVFAPFNSLLQRYCLELEDGLPIDYGDDVDMLWLETFVCLADHDALRLVTGSKGAAGLKPCLLCNNILANGCGVKADDHVEISEADRSRWSKNTHRMVVDMAIMLAGAPNQSQLSKLETHLGWTWSVFQKSSLLDPTVSQYLPIENFHFDAMHDYWSNGLICQQLGLWWTCVHHGAGVSLEALQLYASSGWSGVHHSPAMYRKPASQFTDQLFKDEQDFRGDAMACSLALPICVAFGHEVLEDLCPALVPVLDALEKLYAVILCLQACKSDWTQCDKLHALQQSHLTAWILAHGRRSLRPKAHYALHLQEQIRQWHRLVDCFTCERKHKQYKNLGANRLATHKTDFAKSALLQLATLNIAGALDSKKLGTFLCGSNLEMSESIARAAGFQGEAQVALGLEHKAVYYGKKQILLLDPAFAAETQAAVQIGPAFFLLLHKWKQLKALKSGMSLWQPGVEDEPPILMNICKYHSQVRTALYSRRNDDGTVLLLQWQKKARCLKKKGISHSLTYAVRLLKKTLFELRELMNLLSFSLLETSWLSALISSVSYL